MILRQDEILSLHKNIDTPALIIDQRQLEKNIGSMVNLAKKNNVQLRPHIKTHKSVFITKLLLESGAGGITVAKVGEAEVMANAGIDNIFIANQITHPLKLERLKKLHHMIKLSVGIDHVEQVKLLKNYIGDKAQPLKVLIEIDSGLKRCGVTIGKKLIELAEKIVSMKELSLDGIFTHAGQVYGASSVREIQEIGTLEGSVMTQAQKLLNDHGITINVVSVGSTPTVHYSAKNSVVNEIRPGNFVFYDNIQYVLGSCKEEHWALGILATVISQPEADRVVIDAGSKALNLDKGAHATEMIESYGRLLNLEGKIVRLSEEHGVIQLLNKQFIAPGSPVLIIPNHACAVSNLYSCYHLLDPAGDIRKIPVDARGRSQ